MKVFVLVLVIAGGLFVSAVPVPDRQQLPVDVIHMLLNADPADNDIFDQQRTDSSTDLPTISETTSNQSNQINLMQTLNQSNIYQVIEKGNYKIIDETDIFPVETAEDSSFLIFDTDSNNDEKTDLYNPKTDDLGNVQNFEYFTDAITNPGLSIVDSDVEDDNIAVSEDLDPNEDPSSLFSEDIAFENSAPLNAEELFIDIENADIQQTENIDTTNYYNNGATFVNMVNEDTENIKPVYQEASIIQEQLNEFPVETTTEEELSFTMEDPKIEVVYLDDSVVLPPMEIVPSIDQLIVDNEFESHLIKEEMFINDEEYSPIDDGNIENYPSVVDDSFADEALIPGEMLLPNEELLVEQSYPDAYGDLHQMDIVSPFDEPTIAEEPEIYFPEPEDLDYIEDESLFEEEYDDKSEQFGYINDESLLEQPDMIMTRKVRPLEEEMFLVDEELPDIEDLPFEEEYTDDSEISYPMNIVPSYGDTIVPGETEIPITDEGLIIDESPIDEVYIDYGENDELLYDQNPSIYSELDTGIDELIIREENPSGYETELTIEQEYDDYIELLHPYNTSPNFEEPIIVGEEATLNEDDILPMQEELPFEEDYYDDTMFFNQPSIAVGEDGPLQHTVFSPSDEFPIMEDNAFEKEYIDDSEVLNPTDLEQLYGESILPDSYEEYLIENDPIIIEQHYIDDMYSDTENNYNDELLFEQEPKYEYEELSLSGERVITDEGLPLLENGPIIGEVKVNQFEPAYIEQLLLIDEDKPEMFETSFNEGHLLSNSDSYGIELNVAANTAIQDVSFDNDVLDTMSLVKDAYDDDSLNFKETVILDNIKRQPEIELTHSAVFIEDINDQTSQEQHVIIFPQETVPNQEILRSSPQISEEIFTLPKTDNKKITINVLENNSELSTSELDESPVYEYKNDHYTPLSEFPQNTNPYYIYNLNRQVPYNQQNRRVYASTYQNYGDFGGYDTARPSLVDRYGDPVHEEYPSMGDQFYYNEYENPDEYYDMYRRKSPSPFAPLPFFTFLFRRPGFY